MQAAGQDALPAWRRLNARADAVQTALVFAAALSSLAAAYVGRRPQVLAAGLLMLSIAPYTVRLVDPLAARLAAVEAASKPKEWAARTLRRWSARHHARTAASCAALALLLLAPPAAAGRLR